MSGKVWLVGAGPGDPELLTVKGLRLLQAADAIVYDRLVNLALLDYAPDAELIYVGKTPYRPSIAQEAIGRILLDLAMAGKTVVRLKGGDPYIFGRGSEEAALLAAHGVPVEVVPGISSALAAPALAGIPLTERNVAQSFTVVTGHLALDHDGAFDWSQLPQSGTLVIMMGVRNLPQIAARLLALGRDGQTPAAIIENGSLPEERVICATLATVAAAAAVAEIQPPALVVIGDVVAARERVVRRFEPYLQQRSWNDDLDLNRSARGPLLVSGQLQRA